LSSLKWRWLATEIKQYLSITLWVARDGRVYIVRWSVSAKRSYITGGSAKGRRRAVALLSTYLPTYVRTYTKQPSRSVSVVVVVVCMRRKGRPLFRGQWSAKWFVHYLTRVWAARRGPDFNASPPKSLSTAPPCLCGSDKFALG